MKKTSITEEYTALNEIETCLKILNLYTDDDKVPMILKMYVNNLDEQVSATLSQSLSEMFFRLICQRITKLDKFLKKKKVDCLPCLCIQLGINNDKLNKILNHFMKEEDVNE